MRLKNKVICGFLAVSCAILLHCERSDVLSGVGAGVVSDTDPTLTDTDAGFMRRNLDTSDVDSAYSLPATRDPAFSTRLSSGAISIGKNEWGDTLTAHMQYRVTAFNANNRRYTMDDTIDSAFIYFRVDETDVPAEAITIYRCDTLARQISCYTNSGKVICDTIPGRLPVNRANTPGTLALDSTLKSTGGGITDSILLPKDIADSIFKARTDTAAAFNFAFSIVRYTEKMYSIRNPYIILKVKKPGATNPVRDSITVYSARITAFENAYADDRAKEPYSSGHTLRTAVFKIDIGRITADVNAPDYELLNAVIAFNADSAGKSDSVKSNHPAIFALNDGDYRVAALDADPGQLIAAALHDSLQAYGAHRQTSPNTFSIKSALRRALSNGRTHIYICLRPSSNDGTILWNKPLKVETVFTPSRL